MVIVSNNNVDYQRELAKTLIAEEGDCVAAYEVAKAYGWEGVMRQIRFMARNQNFD